MKIDLRPCGLTLGDYARIMGLDPCLFVGLSTAAACEPFDCEKRRIFIGARDMAQNMIATASGIELCDKPDSLISLHPYFKKEPDFDPVIIRQATYTGEIVYSETDYLCQRLATVAIELDPDVDTLPLDCETLEQIAVVWGECVCPRFEPDWCSATYDPLTYIFTFSAPAYAFIDPAAETVDAYGNVTYPRIDDDSIYLDELTVTLLFTRPREKAVSVWADPCCLNSTPPEDPCETDCCPDCEKEHCFKLRGRLYELEPSDDCRATCFISPKFYRLDGMRRGLWRPEFAEAVVSLMNNLLPESYCNCNQVSAMRYKRDVLIGDRDISANYINPFGILTPGGLLAWRIVSNTLWNDVGIISI